MYRNKLSIICSIEAKRTVVSVFDQSSTIDEFAIRIYDFFHHLVEIIVDISYKYIIKI